MHIKHSFAILATTVALVACAHPSQTSRPHAQEQTVNKTYTVASRYAFADTVARLQDAVRAKGMKVFTLIDHQAAAKEAGLQMQPATVLIFGAPKAGTPLMRKDPAFALQLPMRVLVTEVDGKVQVVYNDTRALIGGSKIEFADVANTLANAETLIRATVTE